MSHGIVSPLPRIVGPTSANISGYVVPAGVSVTSFSSFSSLLIYSRSWSVSASLAFTMMAGYFPSRIFSHQNVGCTRPLEKWRSIWCPFPEGQGCAWGSSTSSSRHLDAFDVHLLISLAWCEIYLIFANVFRKLDMDIHDTTYVCSDYNWNVKFMFVISRVEDFRTFKEFFTPVHQGRNFHAFVKERSI